MSVKKRRKRWMYSHLRKRSYSTRGEAWIAVGRLIRDTRRAQVITPYECRWGPVFENGRSYRLHYHIGHVKPRRIRAFLRRLFRRTFGRYVIWPFLRTFVYPFLRLRSALRYKWQRRDFRARRPAHQSRKGRRRDDKKPGNSQAPGAGGVA